MIDENDDTRKALASGASKGQPDDDMCELYIPFEYRDVARNNHLYFNYKTKKWRICSDHDNYETLKDNFTKVYLVGDYELKDIYIKKMVLNGMKTKNIGIHIK